MKLRKITAEVFHGWRRNAPIRPDRTRPARVLETRILTPGRQGIAPRCEARIVCDDNKIRTFVSGPEGRWVRKGR